MQQVADSKSSGFGKASIGRSFRCQASYDDVKRFYSERLGQDGWELADERQLKDWGRDVGGREIKFRKGDYQVVIGYAGERANYGWDYGIDIGFRQ
ncbi:MAG: hypothetical protein ACREA9_08125 [Pyrinomonadaceae bacterium]